MIKGKWTRYSPKNTPFNVCVGSRVYPLPSPKQVMMFNKGVKQIKDIYEQGMCIYSEIGLALDIDTAINLYYKKAYKSWLDEWEKKE